MSLFGRVFNATEDQNSNNNKLTVQKQLIDKLSEQLNNATLLSDRRAASQGLKNFSKQIPQEIDIKTLDSIIQAIQRDALDDQELAQYLISVLSNICQDGIFEEIIVKDKRNIEIFIELMMNETNSSVLRLDACQLLYQLAIKIPSKLLNQIMSIPNGPSNIVNILNDSFNPPIKYQIVSILLAIIEGSNREDFQKLIVFENLFDKLITIMTEDGGLELGSIIVENSQRLIQILLQDNPANQKYFESDQSAIWLIDSLNSLSRPTKDDPRRQKNICQSIKTLITLLNPDSPSFSNRQSFLYSKCITFITKAIQNHDEDDLICSWFLYLLELLLRENKTNQELFSKILMTTDKQPLLNVLIFKSLSSQEKKFYRLKCLAVIEAFLFKNSLAQETMMSAFIISPPNDHLPSIDKIVKRAAFDRDPRHALSTKIAISLISLLIEDNPKTKESLLTMMIDEDELAILDLIFLKINQDPISFLSLLIVWINRFPKIIKIISSEGAHVQLLLELILTSNESEYATISSSNIPNNSNKRLPSSSSLAAFAIGSLLLYCNEPLKSLNSIVNNRIGLELFCTRLSLLKKTITVTTTTAVTTTITESINGINRIADEGMGSSPNEEADFIISSPLDRIIKRELKDILTFIQGKAFESAISIPILQDQISKLEIEIENQKRDQIKQLAETTDHLTRQLDHYKNLSTAYFEKMLELETENEDLLRMLATSEFNGEQDERATVRTSNTESEIISPPFPVYYNYQHDNNDNNNNNKNTKEREQDKRKINERDAINRNGNGNIRSSNIVENSPLRKTTTITTTATNTTSTTMPLAFAPFPSLGEQFNIDNSSNSNNNVNNTKSTTTKDRIMGGGRIDV